MKTIEYIITLDCEDEYEEYIPTADEVQTALEKSSLMDKTNNIIVNEIDINEKTK